SPVARRAHVAQSGGGAGRASSPRPGRARRPRAVRSRGALPEAFRAVEQCRGGAGARDRRDGGQQPLHARLEEDREDPPGGLGTARPARRGAPPGVPMNDRGSERNQVEVLAEEFLARYRRGEGPSLDDYAARYPELAGEIHEVFPALLLVEEAGPRWAGPGEPRVPPRQAGDRVPVKLGDFRIIREVGRGGMGV